MPENVFLHTNTTTLVTGETLYYKLYCLNPSNSKSSTISKIAYVELVESTKQNVFKHQIYLEKGTGHGDFFVPTTLKSGNYKLIAYTNWMLNKPASEIFQLDIVILNPFEVSEKKDATTLRNEKIKSTNQLDKQYNTENKNFSIQLNKKTFSNREKIELQIKYLNEIPQKGNYSLSVKRVEDIGLKNQLTAKEYANTLIGSPRNVKLNGKEIVLPELRGEMISGSIISKNGLSTVKNKIIALSIPGKSYAFKLVNTNESGKFIFNLDKAYYGTNVIIQIISDQLEDLTIQLDKSNLVDYSFLSFENGSTLDSDIRSNLQRRSIASQIQNAYYETKSDSIAKTLPPTSFFNSLGREYILDDFKRFPTLKETTIEVVTELYYKKDNNNYSLFIRDHESKTDLQQPVLVLVDGLLIQDMNELFNYKTENIYKINFVPGGYYYGPKLFNGVINFTTKNNDYTSKLSGDYIIKPAILRPINPKTYYKQDYTDPSKYDRIPDYRYQLLWIPELTLENKENTISFYSSDVNGTFEIIVEGFTDKGIPISLKETIEVK